MGMKIKSGLKPGYYNKDILELFETMQSAIDKLDVLGQIQSAVGALSMGTRAHDTFECRAKLTARLSELKDGVEQ